MLVPVGTVYDLTKNKATEIEPAERVEYAVGTQIRFIKWVSDLTKLTVVINAPAT